MRKNIYIEMGHHPQVILDTMDQVKRGLHRLETGRKLRRGGGAALIGVGVLVFLQAFLNIIEFDLGFPIAWLGVFAILVGIMLFSVSKSYLLQEHFEAVYQILYTLRDDTGRKGRVVGWLDLSGPRQKEKRVRTALSGGGKQKEYYRDPWFQTKIKLVDGNALRLALVDKVKTKAGSVVNHRTQIKAKLVINPHQYHAGHVPASEVSLPGALISEEDGLISFAAEVSPENLRVGPLLETLKVLYSHLEPIGQGP